MELFISIFHFLQKGLWAVGPFFLLLGILIFIHELGHFLVARYFGVKVEVFSLGFGPKLIKRKKGDTEYCLSLLPLGGYVKMFGDNPLKEVPASEKSKGFLYQKVYAKWLIAFAGPFVNLIFTLLAFFLLALSGSSSLPSQIGDIQKNSIAYKAGFRSGDRVLSVNGQKISYLEELNSKIQNNIGHPLTFKIQTQKNKTKSLKTAPQAIKNSNPLEWKKFTGSIEGLNFHSMGLRLGLIYNSPAYKAGLRSFDEVIKVNGKNIRYWRDLEALIEEAKKPSVAKKLVRPLVNFAEEKKNPGLTKKLAQALTEAKKDKNSSLNKKSVQPLAETKKDKSSNLTEKSVRPVAEIAEAKKDKNLKKDYTALSDQNNELSFTVKRGAEFKDIKLFSPHHLKSSLSLLGIEPAYLYIDRVGPDTPAKKAGLKRGDRLISIDGKKIQSWNQVLNTIKSYSGQAFFIKYRRKDQEKTVSIDPKSLFVEGNLKKRFMLGIVSGGLNVFPEEIIRKRDFFKSLLYSGQETWKWLGYISTGLIRLIQGELSLRNVGGPVQIGRIAHSSFQQGFSSFLFIMALISLNLFFLNLLPIPMLDGGHLLFFTYEGLLGRPLSVKKLIVAQHVGLALLLSFMGFAISNDIYNWLKAW